MPQDQDAASPVPLVSSKLIGELRTALSEGDERPILITIHDYPDPDALASALALQTLVNSWGIATTIAYGGGIGRPENNAMVKLLDIEMTSFHKLSNLEDFKGALITDTQPASRNQSLPSGVPVLAVIDHHTLGSDASTRRHAAWMSGAKAAKKPFTDVRTEVGSSSTLALGYLAAAGMVPDKRLATALFVGVMTDTDSLLRDATAADIAAYTMLLPLADMQLVYGICRPSLGKDFFRFLNSAMNKTTLYHHCLIADCGEITAPDVISTVSDFLIRTDRIAYALAYGVKGNRIYLSLRAKPPQDDATRIILEAVGRNGRGGGHNLSAGGFVDMTSDTWVEVREMQSRFLQAARIFDVPGEMLI